MSVVQVPAELTIDHLIQAVEQLGIVPHFP